MKFCMQCGAALTLLVPDGITVHGTSAAAVGSFTIKIPK